MCMNALEKTTDSIREGETTEEQQRLKVGEKNNEARGESRKAVASVEVSSWTWLCAYKQQPVQPESN